MCLHVIFHPCESGYVQITTVKTVNLQVDASLDFSGAAVNFLAQNVQLLFNQGDINIFVHCSNAICVIPPSDIANGIATAFVPSFVGGIKTSINTAANQYINGHYPTSFPLASLNLELAMDGSYFESNGNLVLAFDGKLTPQNGGIQPPFQPTIAPPASLFSSPASAMTFVITDYLLDTAAWAAVTVNNGFVTTITNSQLPAGIPSVLALTTNNLLFLSSVDGMYKYTGRNMSVTLSVINATADFTAAGTVVSIDLETDYAILNATGSSTLPAFKLLSSLMFVQSLQTPTIVNNALVLNASLGQWKGVILGGSNLLPGESVIELSVFQDALNDVLPLIGTRLLPQISVPLPTSSFLHCARVLWCPRLSNYFACLAFSLTQPTVQSGVGYTALGAAVTYTMPNHVSCTGSPKLCPLGTTCCNNGGNNFGCCPLANAVCCGNGSCCPAGSHCAGNVCQFAAKGKHGKSDYTLPIHML
jgi:hypothetical protein